MAAPGRLSCQSLGLPLGGALLRRALQFLGARAAERVHCGVGARAGSDFDAVEEDFDGAVEVAAGGGARLAALRERIFGSRLSIAPVISMDERNRFARTVSARARELTQGVLA